MGAGQAFGCSSRRGVMAAVPGEWSVEFQAGPDPDAEELAQLVGRLRAELHDPDVHRVTLTIGGDAIDVSGVSSAERDRLTDLWVTHHATPA